MFKTTGGGAPTEGTADTGAQDCVVPGSPVEHDIPGWNVRNWLLLLLAGVIVLKPPPPELDFWRLNFEPEVPLRDIPDLLRPLRDLRERDLVGCTVDFKHAIVIGVVWSFRVIPLRALPLCETRLLLTTVDLCRLSG